MKKSHATPPRRYVKPKFFTQRRNDATRLFFGSSYFINHVLEAIFKKNKESSVNGVLDNFVLAH